MIDRKQELLLAREVGITAFASDYLRQVYELPKKLRRLRVLDIGTGLSDFPAWLRDRGAGVVALDLVYARGVERMIEDSLTRAAADVDREPEALNFTQAMAERFRASLTPDSIYVGGSALSLPFGNASFDLVTSSLGVFGTLDHDYALLEAGCEEALRVLRRGGSMQLTPVFYKALQPAERACESNQRRLMAALRNRRGLAVTDRILGFNPGIGEKVGRLVVAKL